MATYDNYIITSGHSLRVSQGESATGVTVLQGGKLYVLDGAEASDVLVSRGGLACYSHGGTLRDAVFSSGGSLVNGNFDGLAYDITAHSGAQILGFTYMGVSAAKIAYTSGDEIRCDLSSVTVNSGFRGDVGSGGKVTSAVVSFGGRMGVSQGGSAADVTVRSNGRLYVFDGAEVSGVLVSPGGSACYSHGGTLRDAVFSSGGSLVNGNVDGLAYDITAHSGAQILGFTYVGVGAANVAYTSGDEIRCDLSSVTVNSGFHGNVGSGGKVTSAVVSFGGRMNVSQGGSAADVTVRSNGRLYVLDGAEVTGVLVSPGGSACYSHGGTLRDAVFSSGGSLVNGNVDGLAYDITAHSGAQILGFTHVGVGAANVAYTSGDEIRCDLSSVTVNNGFTGRVGFDGKVTSAVVTCGGRMNVSQGGSAAGVIVQTGGKLYVSNGGKVTTFLTIENGATVVVSSGGVVNFDVSAVKKGNAALVNDLSLVGGAPTYTLTVSGNQGAGVYTLADHAAGFNKVVTICTTSSVCSTITVGCTVTLEGQDYTLNLTDALLTLTVTGGPDTVLPGDLNGDGRADVIMSITQSGHGAEGATGAWLIQNDQTAAWGDLSQRNPGWEIFGTGVTDAGKSTNDVYVRSTGNVIGAWVTDDDGHVAGWTTVGTFDGNTQILGLGDFNADGQTDLLLRNVNGAVGCYFTSGETTGWNYFQSLGDEWKLAAVGDLNGDGRDDVVLKHDAGFAGSWLTQSDGTMAWANLDTLPEGFAIVGAGDFDGDGVDDVLLKKDTYYGAWLVEDGSVKSWFGLGDLGNVTVEQIADFDGDGKDDLRIRTAAGDLGSQLVKAADTLEWRYYGSVGNEWSTSLAAL